MYVIVHVYGQCTLQGRYRDFTDFSEVYKWFKFSSDILSYVVELKFHQRFSFVCGTGYISGYSACDVAGPAFPRDLGIELDLNVSCYSVNFHLQAYPPS